MAHWKDAAVTNEGVEMLNEWMAGRKICIVAAFGGTGTVDKELLTEQTGLVDARQELYLLGEEDSIDICRRAYHYYLEEPSEWAREKLRKAYEAVPEHQRMYLGDMDSRDSDYLRILYHPEQKREV